MMRSQLRETLRKEARVWRAALVVIVIYLAASAILAMPLFGGA